jgi:hypothetical protein
MRRIASLWLAAALAGCGAGHREHAPTAAAVIRGWADDLRHGRFDAANRRFALPSRVDNGGATITLRTLREVDDFDRGLTCGAVVTDTRAISGGRILATFRLTERAGPRPMCGTGVGHLAQVTFRIRGGRIVEWLRVGDAPPGSVEA